MSQYKDITLFVDEVDGQEPLINTASQMAARLDARLRGVCVIQPTNDFTVIGDVITSDIPTRDVDREKRYHANIAHTLFDSASSKFGVKAQWLEFEGYADVIVPEEFRLTDLGIIGQPARHEIDSRQRTMNAILLHSARPVLCLPFQGVDPDFGSQILVGYDGSAHATRAIHDAMPFLIRADHVELFSVRPDSTASRLFRGTDMADHLRLHDVHVSVVIENGPDETFFDLLMQRADSTGANMIVAGAWGHSRAREYVFGGATDSLIHESTLPVLFSH